MERPRYHLVPQFLAPPFLLSLISLCPVWTSVSCGSWPLDYRVKVTGRDVLLPQEGETLSQSQMRAFTESDRDGGRASSAPCWGGEALHTKSVICETAFTTGVIALQLSGCQNVCAEKIKYGSGRAIECHDKSLLDELYWPVCCANANMLLNRRGLPRDCREKRWASRGMGKANDGASLCFSGSSGLD